MTTEQEPLIAIDNTAPPISTAESPILKKPFFKTKKFAFIMSGLIVIAAVAYYCIGKYLGYFWLPFIDEPCIACGMG